MYILSVKENCVMPNVLGNHSMPVHTYRWAHVAKSDDESETSLKQFAEKHYSNFEWQIETNDGRGVIYKNKS